MGIEERSKKKLETIKDEKGLLGIGISNLPIPFCKKFSKLAKEEYGDQYNLLFIDLWRKAEAYDVMIGDQIVVPEQQEEQEEKGMPGVQTFAGQIKKMKGEEL